MQHPSDHLCLCNFSPDEREVVTVIVSRIENARPLYGPLSIDTDPRDWEDEAHLEDVDAIVYRTVALVKRKRVRRSATAR